MEIDLSILQEIGLTDSEIDVYLALLKLGSSTKKYIVNESGITPSKLYEITDRLIEKGLVSCVKKNKVKHFSAAPPEQILDFLQTKKERIQRQEEKFIELIPQLESLELNKSPEVEVFTGWKGMRTVYKMMLNTLKREDTDYVIGATAGEDTAAATRFFSKIHNERRAKGIHLRILMNEDDKHWAQEILHDEELDSLRFLKYTSPSEVNIWGDYVMIVLLTKIPVVTLIKSTVAAESFKNYFETLWTSATTR